MNATAQATTTFFQRYGSMVNSGLLISLAAGLLWLGSYRTEVQRDLSQNKEAIERLHTEALKW